LNRLGLCPNSVDQDAYKGLVNGFVIDFVYQVNTRSDSVLAHVNEDRSQYLSTHPSWLSLTPASAGTEPGCRGLSRA
jgi:hypothetical protein